MTQREKGVATAPCGSCKTELPLRELLDGGLTTIKCGCSPQVAAPEQARDARDQDMPVFDQEFNREVATDVEDEVDVDFPDLEDLDDDGLS